ncbi:Protein of unknown function, partial [Gryllus bimaculatus]
MTKNMFYQECVRYVPKVNYWFAEIFLKLRSQPWKQHECMCTKNNFNFTDDSI